ncbi:MAG: glucokinase [Rhodoblastus sp.]
MKFPFPVMVCDVGGTNLRIAICRTPGAALEIVLKEPTAAHRGLESALRKAASAAGAARSVLVCAAGPVTGARVTLTNADWALDGPNVAGRLGLEQGLLLNDFEAQAVALPHLTDDMTLPVCGPAAPADGPMLALGPGTGLGAAALLKAGGCWAVATTEAGHVDFGPANLAEEAFWPHLERVEGRVTFESVLSGPGLARLDAAMRRARGLATGDRDAAGVLTAARAGDRAAIDTIRMFWRLAARCAGDLALIFLARGGVTLSGGVLPRLVDWLDRDEFRDAFIAKAPMKDLLAGVPVRLIVHGDAAMFGMAKLAAAPGEYALDYAARAWRADA